ncbi:restriction endonuclease subunit S [Thiohalophilus thiocyanatoxydans]|uniref:Type I restriction enzyme S subunit n=1 Tax=Thiohalophilus thiocyanatoxydans TaxID=381308 RepID=A0A4R8IX47_9GAMM|nr:restriction endonuclease subunit S [Thiohalophilus thiocyanatoxydans]TDY02427.1 type I restriction enzyme S subunit [Thiohalophilus thiocyanatoxydans]
MTSTWNTKPLKEVSGFQGGSQPPKSQFVSVPQEGYVRLLQIRDFKSDDKAVYIPVTKKIRTCSEDDILIGRYGASVGQIHRGKSGAYNVALIKTIPDDEVIDRNYFYYFLNSALFQRPLMNIAARSAQAGFSKEDIANFPVPVPPLLEQKRIVAILDEAFAGTEAAIANTEKNLANARELFDSYLNAIFSQDARKWHKDTLDNVVDETCSLSYGIVQPGKEFPNGLPVVRPTDLTKKVITLDNLKHINPDLAKSYKRTTLIGNDLLLCVRGSTGVVSIAASELAGANVTRGIVPIRFNSSVLTQEFGYYLLKSPSVQEQIKEKTYGAALMQINIRDMKKLKLSIPPLNKQTDLSSMLDDLSFETRRLESIYQQKLTALAELKQSLLQKAFTGELTAEMHKEAEEAVA